MRSAMRSWRSPALCHRGRRRSRFALIVATALIVGIAVVGGQSVASAQTRAAHPAVAAAPAVITPAIAAVTAAEASARRIAAVTARVQGLAAAFRAAQVAKVQQLRTRIVTVARKQVGDRYSAGASGPSAFDCSGLTRYVYKIATGKDLPHYSRAQYASVKKIRRADAKPGDLVFFFRGGAHHVGVYIGNGHMVDAAGYGEGVRVSPISGSWWSRTYSGMGRLLPA